MTDPVDFTKLGGGLFPKLFAGDFPDLDVPEVEYPRGEAPPPPPPPGLQTELVLDFGTSAITAALVTGSVVELLRFGNGKDMMDAPMGRRWALLNSSLGENYRLTPVVDAPDTGEEEWEYYPCLKRRIEWLARTQGETRWEEEAILDVAAVCWLALREARDSKGDTAASRLREDVKVYLAVPNTFPRMAVEVVKRGVAYGVAGLVGARKPLLVETVLEAEAVAYGVLARDRLDQDLLLQSGGSVLVLDAGAGTTDATIVRVDGEILKVVAHAGLPVGGLDLDAFIASQRSQFDTLDPFEVSRTLRVAREAKELYWSHASDGRGDGAAPPDSHQMLAQHLGTKSEFSVVAGERPLADVLADGHRRYLALAVRALLDCLPRADLDDVQKVIVSGRGSLLMGFQAQVETSLSKFRSPELPVPDIVPLGGGRGDRNERKFAVVRGVAAYAGNAHVRSKRRPIRATFDVVLQRPLEPDHEEVLIPAGYPLLDGWGVRAWHVAAGREEVEAQQRVDMRLIPRRVLRGLVEDGLITEAEVDDLLAWSAMPILKFGGSSPPFSARIDYDFFTLQAFAQVNGHTFPAQRPPFTVAGQLHPVHHQSEDWFERSHTRRRGRSG
jgi:hypothetical protein